MALGVTAVVAFGVAGAATAYTQLQGNIQRADNEHLLGDFRPERPASSDPDDPNKGEPVNILVMGTDSREGSEEYVTDPDTVGGGSDTTIVVHISADRDRVDLVSIPRDSLVDIPACPRPDGTRSEPRENAMFNSAFSIGGGPDLEVTHAATCTQLTVEANTDVFIDHFVVVNMAGFVNMVDALGGVPMCIEQDLYSPKAQLDLSAGQHTLDGVTALAFARARTGEGLGDGSDTGRIARQQQLLGATAQTVLAQNLLTDAPAVLRFLDAATRSLTVSTRLAGITDMAGLALSLQGLSGGNITLMTIPNQPWPEDPNRVVWTDEADDVWAKIKADQPLIAEPEPTPTQAPTTPGATPTSEPTPTVGPGSNPITSDDVTTVCG